MDSQHPAPRPTIGLIGAGRVGSTLARALHRAGYAVVAVASQTAEHAADVAAETGAESVPLVAVPRIADLTLIAVPDDQLAAVVNTLARHHDDLDGRTLAHCSGVQPAAALAPLAQRGAHIGGIHPLASIAQRHRHLPEGITFAVEAEDPARAVLWRLAQDIGGRPFDLRPDARALYHAAAVFASNYTVVLASLASSLLGRAGVAEQAGLDALLPLIRSTIANLEELGLPAALTGPLVRGDTGTVTAHLAALDHEAPTIADVYRALAQAALPLVAAQGHLDPSVVEHLEERIGVHALR